MVLPIMSPRRWRADIAVESNVSQRGRRIARTVMTMYPLHSQEKIERSGGWELNTGLDVTTQAQGSKAARLAEPEPEAGAERELEPELGVPV